MKTVRTLSATAIPFGQANVDTDVIIPARYLKTISRKGLGAGAFAAIRARPGNIFDRPENAAAEILIAGDNFGCGSSREHAPWALLDMGISAVIAPSFADIFAGNSFKNGLLLVALPADAVARLIVVAAGGLPITIDLDSQTVTTPYQDRWEFPIDPFRKHCLLHGLDEIGLTAGSAAAIAAHEATQAQDRPWIANAAQRPASTGTTRQ